MVLSALEIKQCCFDVVETSRLKKLPSTDFFIVMLLTGMRFNDVKLCFNVGSYVDSFKLQPSKNNALRTIATKELPDSFIAFLHGEQCYQYSISYSSILRYFRQCCKYPLISVANKILGVHLFRHNYMKQLFLSGKSVNEIALITGEKTITSAANYIFSSITI